MWCQLGLGVLHIPVPGSRVLGTCNPPSPHFPSPPLSLTFWLPLSLIACLALYFDVCLLRLNVLVSCPDVSPASRSVVPSVSWLRLQSSTQCPRSSAFSRPQNTVICQTPYIWPTFGILPFYGTSLVLILISRPVLPALIARIINQRGL